MPFTFEELEHIRSISPFIRSLPKPTARRLLMAGRSHHWARGSVLFRAGETPEHVFLLLHGLVGLRMVGATGKPALPVFVSTGELFTLAPALLGAPYLVNGEVLQESRVFIAPREAVLGLLADDPAFAQALISEQARESRRNMSELASVLAQTPAQRLCKLLSSIAPRSSTGDVKLQLPCDRQHLAAWLGIAPSSVSRLFQQLEHIGVTGRGRDLTVTSLPKLHERAHAVAATRKSRVSVSAR